ncbi:MAG: glycosyltransferase [Solirubrobacterales bacterium]|nr:glycosyltransferase [Solirubrobacterales bacterium]
MRALVLTQHFTPEVTAGRFRIEAFVEALVDRGHDVDVVCPVPNHPQGVIQPGYRGRPVIRRRVGGADVTYVWVTTSPRKTFVTRLGFYGSFAAAASTVGAIRRRPDVIVASSPPLPVGAAGAVLAVRHRRPWVLDARDLWPESAVALGELSDRRLIALAERLERRLYASATAVVTVNDAFRREIAARAPGEAVIEVIPNGTSPEWLEASAAEPDRDSLALPRDRFIWAYAGNIGLAHGLEFAVEAAAPLGESHLLLIIGEGPRRAAVERRAAALSGAIELRPLMPPARAAEHLRAADALFVSESQERTVASKLYDYCAVGRPVIAACRGELRRVVEEAGVGLTVPYGDPGALTAAVRRLGDDSALRERLCARGKEFARAHLREAQARRFADLVERVAAAADR